jgi:hypothetical protein
MIFNVRQIEYTNIVVEYRVSDASKLLSTLASSGIDFLAYEATSIEGKQTLFTLFSDNAQKMAKVADKHGFKVDGPYSAILVKGDEEIGALAAIYDKLSQANISVDESSGIAHINGGYGVILYIKQEDCREALMALRNKSS